MPCDLNPCLVPHAKKQESKVPKRATMSCTATVIQATHMVYGIVLSGDILLQQFHEYVRKRTYAKFRNADELSHPTRLLLRSGSLILKDSEETRRFTDGSLEILLKFLQLPRQRLSPWQCAKHLSYSNGNSPMNHDQTMSYRHSRLASPSMTK